MKKYHIRPLTPADQTFLWEMLYQSLHVPRGRAPFGRDVLNNPEIARYVKDWGRANDSGFVAADEDNRPVGAIWMRLFGGEEKGFGYVDDRTPELGMAVSAAHRGRGVGTMLLSRLIESAEGDYEYLSLSVSAENPALRLYRRFGFEVVDVSGDALTMKMRLRSSEAGGAA